MPTPLLHRVNLGICPKCGREYKYFAGNDPNGCVIHGDVRKK